MSATNNGKGQWWRIWTAPLMAPLDGAEKMDGKTMENPMEKPPK
jgi:hypothetical protein